MSETQTHYILHCDNSIDGLLTALFEAFALKKKLTAHTSWESLPADIISIVCGEGSNYSLFSTWTEVTTDERKALLTVQTIQKRLGMRIYDAVFHVLCHFDPSRGTLLFHFLVKAFQTGPRTIDRLADPHVMAMMEYDRKVSNEAHFFIELTRFTALPGTLYSRIAPKCTVLPFICDHFVERYYHENFIIYDETHHIAAIHKADEEWFLTDDPSMDVDLSQFQDADPFTSLWGVFFDSVAIRQRRNIRCQNTMLPKWYRKHMEEFSR